MEDDLACSVSGLPTDPSCARRFEARNNVLEMDEGLAVVKLSPDEYTQTNSGNKIFKNASIFGSQNIVIHGKSILMRDCILRGDLTGIRMGKFCFIGERTLIRASHRKFSKGATMFPMHVGDCVIVEEDCVLVAAQIGSYTHIGKGAIVGRSSIIKECCKVEPGAVIASDSIFPPFSVIAGNPARVVGRVPECTQELISQAAKELYESYVIQR